MSDAPEHDTPTGAIRASELAARAISADALTRDAPAPGGVQRKVSAASIASYLGGLGLAAVVQSLQDGSLIEALPPVASAIVAPLPLSLLALVVGYATRNRHDDVSPRTFAASVMAHLAPMVENRANAIVDRRLSGGDQ